MRLKILGISFLFLFAILFYSLRLSVVFFQYAFFNDEFTSLYCVNQDKPEMQCNGKCHLKVEVQKNLPQDQNQNKIQEGLYQWITLYCEDVFRLQNDIRKFLDSKNSFIEYVLSVSSGFLAPSFQPPERF